MVVTRTRTRTPRRCAYCHGELDCPAARVHRAGTTIGRAWTAMQLLSVSSLFAIASLLALTGLSVVLGGLLLVFGVLARLL